MDNIENKATTAVSEAQPVAWLRPDTLQKLADAEEDMLGVHTLVSASKSKYHTVPVYVQPTPTVAPQPVLAWGGDYLSWNGKVIGHLSYRDWRPEGGWMATLSNHNIGSHQEHAEARAALEAAARQWLLPLGMGVSDIPDGTSSAAARQHAPDGEAR